MSNIFHIHFSDRTVKTRNPDVVEFWLRQGKRVKLCPGRRTQERPLEGPELDAEIARLRKRQEVPSEPQGAETGLDAIVRGLLA